MTVFGSKDRDVLDVYGPVDRQYPKPITELDRYNERALRAAMSAAEIDDEKIDMILDDASVDVGCSQLTPSGLHVHGPVNVYWALLFILETYYSTMYLAPGWSSARGCRIEYEVALSFGMAIIQAETED